LPEQTEIVTKLPVTQVHDGIQVVVSTRQHNQVFFTIGVQVYEEQILPVESDTGDGTIEPKGGLVANDTKKDEVMITTEIMI